MTDLDPVCARVLSEHSPRLVISRPTLVPAAGSPTGWVLVVPYEDDPDD